MSLGNGLIAIKLDGMFVDGQWNSPQIFEGWMLLIVKKDPWIQAGSSIA